MSALLFLCSLGCFTLGLSSAESDNKDKVVGTLMQVSSFLVTSSWNIRWLMTPELFAYKTRLVD